MIKCLIVDDEQHSIDVLLHHVKRTDFLELVGTTQDATKAISLINEHNVELLFQDIHMPELSGLDVVKILQGKCEVILTTAYPNYAVEGFELGVTDYLLKPISYPRFMKAVQKAVERMKAAELQSAQSSESDDDFIYVKTGLKNYVVKVVLDTIEYIECVKNYAAIRVYTVPYAVKRLSTYFITMLVLYFIDVGINISVTNFYLKLLAGTIFLAIYIIFIILNERDDLKKFLKIRRVVK